MTVPSQKSQITQNCNGVSTLFPVDFYFLADSHLIVTLTDTDGSTDGRVLQLGSNYSVSGAGLESGGSITTSAIYPTGKSLWIQRVVPVTQETEYQRLDKFPAKTHERALDKLTMVSQGFEYWMGLSPGSVTRVLRLGSTDREGSGAFRSNQNRIQDVADPVREQDATNKRWADALNETAKRYAEDLAASISPGAGTGAFQQIGSDVTRTFQKKMQDIGKTPADWLRSTDLTWDDAFQRWAPTGDAISAGTYKLTKGLRKNGLVSLSLLGDVTLDFSDATDASLFPDGCCFYALAGELTPLGKLSSDVSIGGNLLNLPGAADVEPGDVLNIYDPRDYSFADFPNRPYYRAGEYVPAQNVVGAAVSIYGSLFDSYAAANVDVYRMPRATFTLSGGRLTIISPKAANMGAIRPFRVELYPKVVLDNLAGIGSNNAAISTARCYDVTGTGMYARNYDASGTGTGTGYAIVFGNTQKVNVEGNFHGVRHAVTTGGGDVIGGVPCRDGVVRGTGSNSPYAGNGIGAVNCHGNTEYWTYDGRWDGGFSGGGDHITGIGDFIAKQSQSGTAFYGGEFLGCDFDFSRAHFISTGDPSVLASRGVVDIGGNSVAIGASTKRGGTLNFSGTMDAPDAKIGMMIRNRGCVTTERIVLQLHPKIKRLNAVPIYAVSVQAPTLGGKAFEVVDINDDGIPALPYTSVPILIALTAADKIRGWLRAGNVTAVASTSSPTLSIPVAFDMPAPRTPRPQALLDRIRLGSQGYLVGYSASTATGFTVNISTTDGANFASPVSFTASYSAILEQ